MRVNLMVHVECRGGGGKGAKKRGSGGGERPGAGGEDAAGNGGSGEGVAAGTEVCDDEEVEHKWSGGKAAVGGGEGIENLGRGVVAGGGGEDGKGSAPEAGGGGNVRGGGGEDERGRGVGGKEAAEGECVEAESGVRAAAEEEEHGGGCGGRERGRYGDRREVGPLGLGPVGGERGGGSGGVRVGGVDEVQGGGVDGGISAACAAGVHGQLKLERLMACGRRAAAGAALRRRERECGGREEWRDGRRGRRKEK